MVRRYNKLKRDLAMAETRQRILQATMELHTEQGITATRFEDIAQRADVSLATVYRHFPTLSQLVDGCGALTMSVICPPQAEAAGTAFEGIKSLPARIERLVGEFCAYYQRAERVMVIVQRDIESLPQLQQLMAEHRRVREAFVREALAPLEPSPHLKQVVAGLVDFGTWKSLLDAGVGQDQIPDVLRRLIGCEVKSQRSHS